MKDVKGLRPGEESGAIVSIPNEEIVTQDSQLFDPQQLLDIAQSLADEVISIFEAFLSREFEFAKPAVTSRSSFSRSYSDTVCDVSD